MTFLYKKNSIFYIVSLAAQYLTTFFISKNFFFNSSHSLFKFLLASQIAFPLMIYFLVPSLIVSSYPVFCMPHTVSTHLVFKTVLETDILSSRRETGAERLLSFNCCVTNCPQTSPFKEWSPFILFSYLQFR